MKSELPGHTAARAPVRSPVAAPHFSPATYIQLPGAAVDVRHRVVDTSFNQHSAVVLFIGGNIHILVGKPVADCLVAVVLVPVPQPGHAQIRHPFSTLTALDRQRELHP